MNWDSLWIGIRRPLGMIRRQAVALTDLALNTRSVRTEMQPASYFLPLGYRYRVIPRYFADAPGQPGAEVTAQPDVYRAAADLAEILDARVVVDFGCGRGSKLHSLSGRYDTVGVDFGPNLDYCRKTYQRGMWVEADLESGSAPRIEPYRYDGAVLLSSDVIEHLENPERLLSMIGGLLNNAGVAVLSTPERVRTWGEAHRGPSPNMSHTREWSIDEFRRLLVQSSMRVAYLGYTRSNTDDREGKTILAVCAGSGLTAEQTDLVASAAKRVAERGLA